MNTNYVTPPAFPPATAPAPQAPPLPESSPPIVHPVPPAPDALSVVPTPEGPAQEASLWLGMAGIY